MRPDGTEGDGPENAASAAELAALRATVEALTRRVEELEGRAPARSVTPPPVPPKSKAPAPELVQVAKALTAEQERELIAPVEPVDPLGGTPAAAPANARAAWQVGPLRNVGKEALPVVAMGAAGGIALLMGLLYFAWYSIQQGWVPPSVRLSLVGAFGVAALFQAWRMAPRGQHMVSAALGGAGLGGMFGATLVARHVHGFLGPEVTFGLLVVAAVAGLLVAVQRRLRFLASLSAIGAIVTPLVVGAESDTVHELMAFHLVVVGFLYGIESRRAWPELGHLAMVSTWVLLALPSLVGFADPRWDLWIWSAVYLVLGQVQALYLLRHDRLAPWHAAPRIWLNAFAAWLFASNAAVGEFTVGTTTLIMALWNVGFVVALLQLRPKDANASVRRAFGAALAGGVSVAWLQLFLFPSMRFGIDDAKVPMGWLVMAGGVTAFHVRRPRVATFLPIVLPWFGALTWCMAEDGQLSLVTGFLAAAMPLVIALWPGRTALAEASSARHVFSSFLLVGGSITWLAVSERHLLEFDPRGAWVGTSCLLAAGLIVGRAVMAPGRARITVTLVLLLGVTWTAVVHAANARLFRPILPSSGARPWHVATLVGVALLALWIGRACRRRAAVDEGDAAWLVRSSDFAGLVRPVAWLVAAMLLVAGVVPQLTDDPSNAASLNQAGWSVCWAVGGLAMLLRGLFARRPIWRRAGMLLLFTTAAKLLLVDLVAVSIVWRVLSFLGLGVCLLLGAYAYRRLGVWIEREAETA